jgi:hypothetical protein
LPKKDSNLTPEEESADDRDLISAEAIPNKLITIPPFEPQEPFEDPNPSSVRDAPDVSTEIIDRPVGLEPMKWLPKWDDITLADHQE